MRKFSHLIVSGFFGRRAIFSAGLAVALSAAPCLEGASQVPAPPAPPVPTAPPFTPPALQPSLLDFLTGKPIAMCCKLLATDTLQRPPFAGAPLTDPKGLAAKIRAEQLDAKNRIMACEYLGTVDCVAYPEARAMLVETMQNDKYESVRYSAAVALGNMMNRGKTRRDRRKMRRGTATRFDTCRGCCNDKVLAALAKTAYESDQYGCPFEPSERVREAAKAAIENCGCDQVVYGPIQPPAPPAPPVVPLVPVIPPREQERQAPRETAPVPLREEAPPPRVAPPRPREGQPKASIENNEPQEQPSAGRPGPDLSAKPQSSDVSAASHSSDESATLPPLKALNGYCIVSLKCEKFVKADEHFQSVYKHRTYQFADAAAKSQFDASPETYSVRYNGVDPVEFRATGNFIEGQYLREHEGRYYLFASRENWNKFKANPKAFAGVITPAANFVPPMPTPAPPAATHGDRHAPYSVTPVSGSTPSNDDHDGHARTEGAPMTLRPTASAVVKCGYTN